MPRNETLSKTSRVAVDQVGETVGLEVNSRISASAGQNNDPLFQLADSLTVGSQFMALEDTKQNLQGATDFQQGVVDESNTNQSYQNAVSSLRTRARWIQDSDEFDESLKSLDLENISQGELDTHIDELFRAKYDQIDDPVMAKALVPRMQKYRTEVYERVLKMQEEAEIAENAANLTQTAEEAYKAGQFDYHQLNKDVSGVFQGGDRNEVYFRVLADMAIRNGDPELLRNIPDRWIKEDGSAGQATFKHIPDFNERMLNAELRAISAKTSKEKAAAEAIEAQSESLFNQRSLEAMELVFAGDEAGAQELVYSMRDIPGIDPKDIYYMHKGMSALNKISEQLPADNYSLADLAISVYDGSASMSDVAEAFGKGVFGYDDGGFSNMRQMLSVIKNRSESDSEVNRAFSYNVSLIKSAYNPKTKGELGKINGEIQRHRDLALKVYERKVYREGMDPQEAFEEVRTDFDERFKKLPSSSIDLGQGLTPGQAIGHLLQGDISPSQALGAGLNKENLQEALRLGYIRDDQFDYVLSLIVSGE